MRPHLLVRSLFLAACVAGPVFSASAQETPAPAVDAPRPLVVMNLAAHPDDEDGATLTYYRHAKNAMAYSVIFTRGEGGQNEIGPELYEALGAIRSRETEQAARTLGTQVQFLNFFDFGFSKIASEAFEKWGGRDYVTARLVYLMRKLKPDVVFTNHDTVTVGPRRQHGQHQAVGNAAYDAFALAADASYHPEQLKEPGVDLWQPSRLFLRRFFNPESSYDVSIPVGDTDGATGSSYAGIAADALGHHASQGMDQFAQRLRGMTDTRFVLLRSATDAPPTPNDLAGNLPANTAAQPDVSYLVDAGRVRPLPDGTLRLADSLAVPGQHVSLRWAPDRLPTRRLRWEFHGAIDTTLYLSDSSPGVATLQVRADALPSVPRPVYQYERFTNHPPVTYAAYQAGTEELLAAGYLPLEIAPPLFLETDDPVVRLRSGANTLAVRVQVYDPAAQHVTLNAAVSRDADRSVVWHEQLSVPFGEDGRGVRDVPMMLPEDLAAGDYTITLTGLSRPATRAPTPYTLQVQGRVFDVAVAPGLRVGVVQSYDNTLEQTLQDLGVDYVMLDSTALASGDLSNLQTIVVDIRAYLVRQDLRRHNDRLLQWVHDGGHLIVNYQKTFEWNPGNPDPFDPSLDHATSFAPYPLVLGRDRVTREDAPVRVQYPDHPLMHRPNTITPDAWDGWVQERGLYFPETWDEAYTEMFCMNDPGEAPHCGSTLLASYGEGTYLYTALVWYRQLKVYHPGAYALFANMISLPLD